MGPWGSRATPDQHRWADDYEDDPRDRTAGAEFEAYDAACPCGRSGCFLIWCHEHQQHCGAAVSDAG